MTSHPASDLLASKADDRDRPVRYPRELPAIELPWTRAATGRR